MEVKVRKFKAMDEFELDWLLTQMMAADVATCKEDDDEADAAHAKIIETFKKQEALIEILQKGEEYLTGVANNALSQNFEAIREKNMWETTAHIEGSRREKAEQERDEWRKIIMRLLARESYDD